MGELSSPCDRRRLRSTYAFIQDYDSDDAYDQLQSEDSRIGRPPRSIQVGTSSHVPRKLLSRRRSSSLYAAHTQLKLCHFLSAAPQTACVREVTRTTLHREISSDRPLSGRNTKLLETLSFTFLVRCHPRIVKTYTTRFKRKQLPEENLSSLDNPLKLDTKIPRSHILPQERKRIEIPIAYRRLLLEKNRLAGPWDIFDLNGGRERWRRRDRSNGVCSDIKGAKGLGFTVRHSSNHGSVL
ncbi:4,5-DOPA dioxygenase extradiol 1 [Fusarium oxysporum f. sp. albedinis]|nr:4,5-DOPA dioxygenase extradiol 1 [Fusarium oxysporum f. sp. albedinis]